jgi:L-rhamnose isomerase
LRIHNGSVFSRCRHDSEGFETPRHDEGELDEMTTFEKIAPQLAAQAIELPSWAFGNSGTRFKVFSAPGTPRTIQEKIADAAQVNQFTGLASTVDLKSGYQARIVHERVGGVQASWGV